MSDGPNDVRIRRLRLQLDRASLPRARLIVRALAQELGAHYAAEGQPGAGTVDDAGAAPGKLHGHIAPATSAESPRAFARRAVKALAGDAAARARRSSPTDFRQC